MSILNSQDYSAVQSTLQISENKNVATPSSSSAQKTREELKSSENGGSKFTFSKTGFSLDQSEHFRVQELNRFQRENADLLHVIDQSDDAKELLGKTDIQSRDDLVKVIAQTAHDLLSGDAGDILTEEKLKGSSLIASMIVLNTGGLRDVVADDADMARILAETDAEPESDSFKAIAKKTAALFVKGSPLDDEAFFEQHSKVAIYLLHHADKVSQLNKPDDGNSSSTNPNKFLSQNDFKDRVSDASYQDLFDSDLASRADAAVNSGAYSSTFFSDNIDVAEYVVAGEFIDHVPKPSEILGKHPEFNLDNPATNDRFNASVLIREILTHQASTMMGPESTATPSVLKSNMGLARLIVQHEELRERLSQQDSGTVLKSLAGNGKVSSPSEETLALLKKRFQATFEGPKAVVSILA